MCLLVGCREKAFEFHSSLLMPVFRMEPRAPILYELIIFGALFREILHEAVAVLLIGA